MAYKRTSKLCSMVFWLLVFVPLISVAQAPLTLPELIYDSSEHFSDIDSADLDGLLERIGDSRVVLLGEATHGTAEFYNMRARITQELIKNKGFTIVAVEADWPDATSIDHFIRGTGPKPTFTKKPFSEFPSWMWANHSVLSFTHWLKDYNQRYNSYEDAVGFYGLDFYNIYSSIEAVLDYLQDVDPKMAKVARHRYGCLMPLVYDPSLYSHLMQSRKHRGCENEVLVVLQALRNKREFYRQANKPQAGQLYFNAEQNARLVSNGERFYRNMYTAENYSRNQRHKNFFESLVEILKHHGQTSKVVVWAHNTHIGDVRATEMSAHKESNLGQQVREAFGDSVYLVGFGTDHGTVAAANDWGKPVKVMQVQSAHNDSYEHLFHEVKADNFLLPLRHPIKEITRRRLLAERLQRAIGTSYDPEDELKKHYFYASLPRQFDEYIWFDETRAVKPLIRKTDNGSPRLVK